MSRSVVTEKVVLGPDGKGHRVLTPFENLPDWAKHVVRPRWDHPGDCECADCWQASEAGGRGAR